MSYSNKELGPKQISFCDKTRADTNDHLAKMVTYLNKLAEMGVGEYVLRLISKPIDFYTGFLKESKKKNPNINYDSIPLTPLSRVTVDSLKSRLQEIVTNIHKISDKQYFEHIQEEHLKSSIGKQLNSLIDYTAPYLLRVQLIIDDEY